jgi:transposase
VESTDRPTYQELVLLLADRDATVAEQTGVILEQARLIEELTGRVADLERQAGKDSSTSSRPPSSDSPYTKPAPKRSSRKKSGRAKGKQPGEPGSTQKMVDDPDETVFHDPPACSGCGASPAGAPVSGVRRHQVFDVPPPPPRPRATEHRVVTRECPCCGAGTQHQGL